MHAARRWASRDWQACGPDDRLAVMDGDGANVLAWMEAAGEPGRAVGAFMARWDPAAVRRDIDAKRLMVKLAFRHAAKIDGEWGCCHSAEQIEAGRCKDTKPDDLELLQLLALPYADHPDYDPAWKPEV